MTDREQAIATLTEHLDHWKRLLSEGICTKDEGERTIDALTFAIESIKVDSEEIKILQKRSYLEGFHEALKMSVKQEPCEDCISRAEAQKHIYRRLWESALNNVGYECKAEDVFMDIADNRLSTWISEISSIQPKADVLDKIRAEIEQTANDYEKSDDYRYVRGLWIALEIIDKYKAEKE